jgi:hypothetical protein
MSRTPLEGPEALRRLQRAFLSDLTGAPPRTRRARARIFAAPSAGTVEGRWHVYAHGYLARLTEALELTFPAVRRILGEAAFTALVERFVREYPPVSFDLARAGDLLPLFLERDAFGRQLPFLPDLARLERRIAEAFVAPDAALLTTADLRGLPPEDVARLSLRLAPGAAVVRSDYPLFDLWMCRTEEDDEAVSIELGNRPSVLLVSRPDVQVLCRPVGEDEALLAEGAAWGEVTLEGVQGRAAADGDEHRVARFVRAFAALVESGVFVKPRTAG